MPEVSTPESDWKMLETALANYVGAARELWAVRGPRSYWPRHKEIRFKTSATADAPRTPSAGHLVRGSEGVRIEFGEVESDTTAHEVLTHSPIPYPGLELSKEESLVAKAIQDIRRVLEQSPSLRRGLARARYGIWPGLVGDPALPGLIDAVGVEIMLRIEFARFVASEKQVTLHALEKVDSEIVREFVDWVRKDVEATHRWFTVTALLNAPVVDLQSDAVLWTGDWGEQPCFLSLGYPSDSACERVLRTEGHTFVPSNSQADQINCRLSFTYAVPVTMTVAEANSRHYQAGDYVREAADLIRLVSKGDVGILHLSGDAEPLGGNRLRPIVYARFKEGHPAIHRVPHRGVFDPPDPTDLISNETVLRLGRMFEVYSIKRVRIPGLPVAMERLRAIYERYSPDELGRLVDAVTGLEALYLTDAQTTEIGYRLQVRIPIVLGTDLSTAEKVELAMRVRRIYELRSALVHKGEPIKKLRGKTRELEAQAIDLLKRSIEVFLARRFGEGVAEDKLSSLWLREIFGG